MAWLSEDDAWAVWLAIAMLLGVAELFSLDLVLLMLSAGALVGMLTALAGLGLTVQLLAAVIASVAMLGLVRPSVTRRLHRGPELRQGVAALVGREGFALTEVSVHSGQVKLGGEVWTARPYDEHAVIADGAKVQVLEIRGATAYVTEVPQLGA